MKNKKIIILSIIGTFSIVLVGTFAKSTSAKNLYSSNASIGEKDSKKMISEESLNNTLEVIDSKNTIDEKMQVLYTEPSYLYKNMKEKKVDGEIQSSSINDFECITKLYNSDDNKEIRIQQAQDTGKPYDLLSVCKKISIKGVEAWVYGESSKDSYAQLLMWYNGIYYNISGDIGVEELTNIASSYIK